MRRILCLALAGAMLLTMAGPAAAGPPQRERFTEVITPETGVSYRCGDVLVTEDGGTIQGWWSVQEKRSGEVQTHWSGQAQGLTAVDEAGNRYRIVGSGGGVATWAAGADSDEDEPIRGHFGLRLNILHADGGLFGRVHVRGQMRQGEFVFTERGDCVEL